MKLELIKKDGNIAGYCIVSESEEEKQVFCTLTEMYSHGENESLFSIEHVKGQATEKDEATPANRIKFLQYRHVFTSENELTIESVQTRTFAPMTCAKCGGTNVTCEAQVYPNTGELDTIAPDACDYGWCEDCEEGMPLCDINGLATSIDGMFQHYVETFKCEPQYALCNIFHTNDQCREDVVIKLSQDYIEGQDDNVFFFCNGSHVIKQMIDPTVANYVILTCHRLYRIENNEEIY